MLGNELQVLDFLDAGWLLLMASPSDNEKESPW